MWLKDFLPKDLKDARIMAYGYDSRIDGPHTLPHRLVNFQRTFLEEVENFRCGAEKRPIIFVGHSLGGLIILETLIESSKNDIYKHVLQSSRVLVFFGTPLDGLRTEELENAIADINAKLVNGPEGQSWRYNAVDLIRQLTPGSDYLERLRGDVAKILNGFPGGNIISFYETARTNTVRMGNDGRMERGEHQALMVERFSALLRLPAEQVFPIDEDHSNMAKFSSPVERSYRTMVRCMSKFISTTTHLDDILNQVKDGQISWEHILALLSWIPPAAAPANLDLYNPHHFWILKNSVFRDWVTYPSSQLLCISRKDTSQPGEIAFLAADCLKENGTFVFFFSCVNAEAQESDSILISFAHSLLYEIVTASDENLKPTLLHTFLQFLHDKNSSTKAT
ncbi:hypothetical protein K440DRAFT_663433 [Wilcoxina mikolae CBS 423.85]|nr:hypothetical protein K440DRAFT_663433 [Wilcoxina mikolae CBS 423.85]